MLWLLDTCVVSETFKREPDAKVLAWLAEHAAQAALPVIALGEIQHGIERMPEGRGRNTLQAWRDQVAQQFGGRTLVADEPVLRTWGRLRASLDTIGRPQQDMDVLIAATAAVHGLALVTRNTRHFQDTGVPMVNPWSTTDA